MPSCSIKQCSARRTKDQPTLSVHRFPRSEVLRRKWLEAIGTENINARHKELFICSLHFEESQFNKTLDVIRLRDNAVPTLFNKPRCSIQEETVTAVNRPREIMASDLEMPSISKLPVSFETCYVQVYQPKENLPPTCEKIGRQSDEKLQKLQKVCEEQRKKIKRLNEKIRRQGKTITSLQDIITDLTRETRDLTAENYVTKILKDPS